MASFMNEFEHLEIPLEEIKLVTDNFNRKKVIGIGGFGKVYEGKLSLSDGRKIMVALKRLEGKYGQGGPEFFKEIKILCCYRHENLISLLGFCKQGDEMILVYEHASRGSLDHLLSATTLTWTQRLKICLDAAKGLRFLHDPNGTHQRILHCDIKSANILLDENLKAKVSDFGLSKMGPANQKYSDIVTNPVGTPGYCDPLFLKYSLTKESDVYSFGVVLFEVLCGRLCVGSSNGELEVYVPFWKQSYEENKLHEIIFKDLMQQMDPDSLATFSSIAYQCLKDSREERPAMSLVVEKLEIALDVQERYDMISKQPLPKEYEEIVKATLDPLTYTTLEELKLLLLQVVLLKGGKTLLSINDYGHHCERIYIETCINLDEIEDGSLQLPSDYNNSRFPGGRCHEYGRNTFKAHVRAQFLSPQIIYTVNLVFRYKSDTDVQKYMPLRYKLKSDGDTKLVIVHHTDEIEDGWFMAELYQHTSEDKTVDLEFMFEECQTDLLVAGIEFNPFEDKANRVYSSTSLHVLPLLDHPKWLTFFSYIYIFILVIFSIIKCLINCLKSTKTWLRLCQSL